jgi:hypothetical protein
VTVTPWYPVLDDNGDSPNYRLDLQIYNKNTPNMNSPFTKPLQGDYGARLFAFHFSWGSETKIQKIMVKSVTFHADLSGPGEPKDLIVESVLDKDSDSPQGIVRAFLNANPNEVVPWGMKGSITWQFDVYFGDDIEDDDAKPTTDPSVFYLRHPFEMYLVSGTRGKMTNELFWRKGIPRRALQFYLIDSKKYAEGADKDLDKYVAAIVNAVHKGTGHIYDVWNGRPRYTSVNLETGVVFNLNRWAKNILPDKVTKDKERSVPRVNCVDQSAAVYIGVCLGLPDDNAVYDSLLWHWAVPFGYVRETRLVGWSDDSEEKFNNAYFDGDRGKMLIKDLNSADRKGFWSHHFVAFKERILDATCGPAIGDESIQGYLKTTIDYDAGKETKNEGWRKNIENEKQDRILQTVGGATAGDLEVIKRGISDLDSQFWTRFDEDRKQLPEKAVKTIEARTIIFTQHTALLADIRKLMGVKAPSQDGDPSKITPIPDVGARISWEVTHSDIGRVTVDVYIADNEVVAAKVFKNLQTDSERPALKPYKNQPFYLVGVANGFGWHLWHEMNIVVSVLGLGSNDALEPYVGVVKRYISKEDKIVQRTKITSITIGGKKIQGEYKCKVGDVLKVEVAADYGFEFALDACDYGVSHHRLSFF